MNAKLWTRFGRWATGLTAAAALFALLQPAGSQESPPAPKAKPAPTAAPETPAPQDPARDAAKDAREAARDAAKGAREGARSTTEGARDTAQDARRDARDAAKGAREGARDAAEGAREGAQDARRDAREGVRDARGDLREARRDMRRDFRAADFGLWFNRAAGARGLVIADVAAQGAIAKLGFREGDRIVSVNGQPVATEAEFTRLITDDKFRDQQVKVVVMRDNREEVIVIQPAVLMQEVAAYDPLWQYGIILDDRVTDRVVIQRVFPRTPAYYAGLRAGDTIVGLRGQRIAAVADFVRGLSSNDGQVALQINRGNQTRDIQLESSSSFDSDVRTTLRPQIDDPTRTPAPADTRPRIDGTTPPRTLPDPAPAPTTPGTRP